MPKIQGKQIAESTITQDLLNLTTPDSGQTSAAATVEYVNTYISSGSGTTVIGAAEDGSYTDGIFTDFVPTTPIGTAVDRFNEMLLLLAPTPPTTSWDNVFSGLNISSTEYSARALTSGAAVSNITTDTTPSFSLTDTVGNEDNARALPTGAATLTFIMSDTSGTLETEDINSGSTGDASGIIQYTVADPYAGQSGKAGFWTGITSFSVSGTITSPITPSASQRTLTFAHPGIDTPETYNYYVDNATTPSVGTISASMPSMSNYISGVPTLVGGQTISGISFTVTNAVSYFYNNSFYDITGTFINNDTANPPSTIPTTAGQSVSESGLSVIIGSGSYYDDDSFQFNVVARSANGASNTNTYTSSTHRIDTVSSEATRLVAGTGSYPATGWGGSFDSTQSLVGTYTSELMMRNGTIIYPTGDYSAYGGPNYSAASGTRYVMYNLGTFSNNSAFTLNFNGASGISTIGQANLVVEVKISGATFWVDGDASYSGSGNPGSSTDGTAAVVFGDSTPTSRRITFGGVTYSGAIIVRVGYTGAGPSFTSLTATSIV
jgi:hypothetical protein